MSKQKRFVFPVIHHLDGPTSLDEAEVAFAAGADGVFLISHHGQDAELFEPAMIIKNRHKDKLVGLNLLGSTAIQGFLSVMEAGLDMAWTDRPGVTSREITREAQGIASIRERLAPSPLFFASVAFKYQRAETDPGLAATNALQLGFIPTTSGAGTGSAPELEKISGMRLAIGPDAPLAIASGMNPANIANFAPHLTHILVSTGVSKDAYHLDLNKLAALVSAVRTLEDFNNSSLHDD